MICKLKLRFDLIYADYRRFLWTVIIIQALSLLISATTNILLISGDAMNDFLEKFDDVVYYILHVIYDIVAWIVPMLT